MSTDAAEDIRRLVSHVQQVAETDIPVELWDGSRVPADAPSDGLRLVITSPAVLSRLMRRPSAATLIQLHVEGLIDIRGGTLFDLAERRPTVRSRDIRRRLDKGLILRTLLPYLFRAKRAAGPADALSGGPDASAARGSSQADIAFHYDVSNRFYELFLDPLMVYTCAYFRDFGNDLATAQEDKLEMICRKLRLKPGDRLLDIGCGWGALISHAVEHHGATALGVTLSTEQASLAETRIAARGLSDRARVQLVDYQVVTGQFDKIASIGMFEHVGIDNHDAYYRTIHKLLAPGGLYLHHAITRRGKATESAFRKMRSEYKLMTRYIFPGAEVDHIGLTLRSLEARGFEVHDVEGWREHYARTTELWARRLMANRAEAVAEVGEARYRLWVLYFSGVSLAFSRGTLQIFQTLVSKRAKGPSGLPPTREDLYR
ncbi:MAG TPA: cyclopropane-fatty-acyl-phospholipid synthase family protein [Methylomirabilota bacterium]|nr:cyclopropane-fatty-acyl-phospholipid synthase family protein [Methylomirabilota bacterium]